MDNITIVHLAYKMIEDLKTSRSSKIRTDVSKLTLLFLVKPFAAEEHRQEEVTVETADLVAMETMPESQQPTSESITPLGWPFVPLLCLPQFGMRPVDGMELWDVFLAAILLSLVLRIVYIFFIFVSCFWTCLIYSLWQS